LNLLNFVQINLTVTPILFQMCGLDFRRHHTLQMRMVEGLVCVWWSLGHLAHSH